MLAFDLAQSCGENSYTHQEIGSRSDLQVISKEVQKAGVLEDLHSERVVCPEDGVSGGGASSLSRRSG